MAFDEPVSDGCDAVSQYMIEWSKKPWNTFDMEVQTLTVTCRDNGGVDQAGCELGGSFRPEFDTSGCDTCPPGLRTVHQSQEIAFDVGDCSIAEYAKHWNGDS